jgi:hypothetical protein
MNYCSLDDAFQAIGGVPGCTDPTAAKQARKEERRKARKCKGPALTFFDPDRPVQETVEPYTDEDFHHKKHRTPDQDTPNFDKDPLYEYVKREVNDHVMKVSGSTSEAFAAAPTPSHKKSFFGADPDDMSSEPSEPAVEHFDPSDYATAFQPTRLSAPAAPQPATSAMPFPNMYWKSNSPAQSAFIEHLPPMPIHSNRVRSGSSDPEMAEMKRKIDRLFAQLEDLKGPSASPEQITSEIMMFVSSGIVILFLMDLMVKKGSMLRM